MKVTALLATLALTLTPSLALAMCGGHETKTTQTCAEGHMLDAKTGTCVKAVVG